MTHTEPTCSSPCTTKCTTYLVVYTTTQARPSQPLRTALYYTFMGMAAVVVAISFATMVVSLASTLAR